MMTFIRFLQIHYVLVKYNVDQILSTIPILKPLKLIRFLFPPLWRVKNNRARGESIRLALEELGPIYIKFGQALSTRRDLLPEDIADALISLQDNVPPFSSQEAMAIIEEELRQPISAIFKKFNPQPLASASIAQVHAAQLLTGEEVIVKVLRPGILKRINSDLLLLVKMARLAQSQPTLKRFKPLEFVEEFKMTLLDELDLLREAANASQLKRHATRINYLYIPEVYWEFTHTRVMVAERVYGVRISDTQALYEKGVDFELLGDRLVQIFFTQVFHDCFFHADMHPGNLFVDCSEPHSPAIIAVDFGIMGSLSRDDQHYLAENFLAFFKRDYRRVAELHIESGWVPFNIRVDAFESSIRTVCEPIFERPLREISFAQTLTSLFKAARRFDVEIQPQFLLLQKTLMNVEGLGRQLNPNLDLWRTAKPILESWAKKQVGVTALVQQLKVKFPRWVERMPEMPDTLYQLLNHYKQHIPQNAHYSKCTKPPRQLPYLRIGLALICLISGGFSLILKPQALNHLMAVITFSLILSGSLLLFSAWQK